MIGVLPIDGEFCYLLRNNLQNQLNQGKFLLFYCDFPSFCLTELVSMALFHGCRQTIGTHLLNFTSQGDTHTHTHAHVYIVMILRDISTMSYF